MKNTSMSARRLFVFSFLAGLGLLAASALSAWSGPTQSPPAGNVPAPVNVGTADQVKNAGLALNSLLVSGNAAVYSGTGQVKLGVNTSNPLVPLDVAGTIRIGNTGEQCQAVSAGALRWNSASKTIDFCNGTQWQALSTTTAPTSPPVTPQTFTFSSPGTHAFAIVPYNTMRVRVWGGGGGGSSVTWDDFTSSSGGTSMFNYALYAYGGTKASDYSGGTGGSWSGGSGTNGVAGCGVKVPNTGPGGGGCSSGYGGSSPYGGAGGARCASGGTPGGGGGGGTNGYEVYGGGGGGGYTEYTYSAGQFTVGAIVTLSVGGGGTGQVGAGANFCSGGSGASGRVQIIVN